jgi:hypothetical protein
VSAGLDRSAAPAILRSLDAGQQLTHHHLDDLPAGKAVEHLRTVLVATGTLLPRDEQMVRLERWITRLAEDPDAALEAITAARAVTRERVWNWASAPLQDGLVVIDLDATLVIAGHGGGGGAFGTSAGEPSSRGAGRHELRRVGQRSSSVHVGFSGGSQASP